MPKVVVGRFPPPLGGVTVFVQRKYASLQGEGALRLDLGDRFWPFKLINLARSKENIFLLNTGSVFLLLIFLFLGLLPRTILYDHNSSRKFWANRCLSRVYLYIIREIRDLKVVHEHLSIEYRNKGYLGQISIESPFIPPREIDRDNVLKDYPKKVLDFMSDKSCMKIVSSAWRYNEDSKGNDIYGISSLLKLLTHLHNLGAPVRCLLAFGIFNTEDMPENITNQIRRLELDGKLVLLTGQRELWPVFRCADIFLRLTSTDGESVSILESLHFGCKVLASDVVPRPQGVATYEYGDFDDLIRNFYNHSGLKPNI